MTAANRKAMGKAWKLGDKRLGSDYESFYLEFKKEIDSELKVKE